MIKKVLLILTICILSFSLFAQSYNIYEKKGKYGLTDSNGKLVIPAEYSDIYECKYVEGYFIGISKKYKYFLLNPKTKKFFEINEYEDELELDEECLVKKGKILRFIEKGKTGLFKFPDSVLLPAEYKMIYPFRYFENCYLLEDKKRLKVLNLSKNFESDWFKMYYSYESLYIDDGYSFIQSEEYIIAEFDNGFRMFNLEGDEFLLAKVEEGEYYIEESDLLLAYKNGKYGYVDYYGKTIIPFKYEDAGPRSYSTDLMYVKIGEKYCYIDSDDNIVLPCIYDEAGPFIDIYADVVIDGKEIRIDDYGESEDMIEPVPKDEELDIDNPKWGYINSKGDVVIDYMYDKAKFFTYGLAPVKKEGKWGYISQVGSIIIDFQFQEADEFSNGLAKCKQNDKWGFINFNGEFVINNIYDIVGNFSFYSNLALVGKKINGEIIYGCIDSEGKQIIDYNYEEIKLHSYKLFPAKKENKWGFIDKKGKKIIEFTFDDAKEMSNDRAAVMMDNKWGFIDKEGKLIIDYKYDDAKKFYNMYAPVKIGDKWGYINTKGEMVIEAQFDEADHFYYKTARVKKDGKKYSINKKGEIVK